MQSSKFFKAEQIAEGVTQITGLGNERCFLIEGKKKALLIDTLTGVGNLKAFCQELTDLPIIVVNTHGHVDHCGGNFDFGECYIHPDDIELMYTHASIERRMGFVVMMQKMRPEPVAVREDQMPKPIAIKTYPIYDRDIFDLGDRQLEVIAVPGHSEGTVVLLERKLRLVFSGDACNMNTLLFLRGSTSIEEYLESLRHFKTFQPAFDWMYGGHGIGAVPNTLIDEAIELCHEIMTGQDDAVASVYHSQTCFYAKKAEQFKRLDGKTANIAYRRDGIMKQLNTRVID